jgi:hypothetical protein
MKSHRCPAAMALFSCKVTRGGEGPADSKEANPASFLFLLAQVTSG